jgi:hypothetical protein
MSETNTQQFDPQKVESSMTLKFNGLGQLVNFDTTGDVTVAALTLAVHKILGDIYTAPVMNIAGQLSQRIDALESAINLTPIVESEEQI